ncbi:MAG TPA: DUF4349 domain-containing protein [Thermoleophilia bacterium]|nr:DUF4349 domain-containing protein [Thermoleophilia bacterium]
MTRRAKIGVTVPLVVVAVLAVLAGVGLLAACGSSGSSSGTSSGFSGAQAAAGEPAPRSAGGSDGASAKSLSGNEASGSYAAALPPASTPSAHYLVRTGDMSLLVARGTLLASVDRIKAMTAAMNGYVMSSSVGTQSGGAPEPMPLDTPVSSDGSRQGSGAVAAPDASTTQTLGSNPYASLVVRVPEQLFDTAIKRFSKLGTVQTASTSSEDVTSQYVDLQARLKHYRAVERRLVGFLQQTRTINQMLAVQDRIDKVQLTIEELSAEIKSLSETTTYGTLSVYVTEKDRPATTVRSSNSFGGTLGNSIELLGRGIRFSGLVLTALAPFILVFGGIGALVWYVVRRVRRNRRHAAPPTRAA